MQSETKKGLSTQAVVLIIVGILVISAAAVIIALILRPETVPLPTSAPVTGAQVMTEENYVELGQETREKVEKSMFMTHMNTTWRFEDGESASHNAVMGNHSSNNYPFYFTVTVKETDEIVFTSGILPVGTQIASIVLEKDLDPGTYPALVNVHMIEENNEVVESNTAVNITLEIEG